MTFLDGVVAAPTAAEHCAAVGRRAGAAASGRRRISACTRANALGLDGWRPLFERFADRADDDRRRALRALIDDELSRSGARTGREACPQESSTPTCFPTTCSFSATGCRGLIDFYFACNDALAYDIAVCLNAWCFEPDMSFNVTKGRALLAGYQACGASRPAERAALPMLARGAALRFLLTRAYDWLNTPKDALVKPKDPTEYLRRLRFHQGVRATREYGLGEA